jgi:hypothetical protein
VLVQLGDRLQDPQPGPDGALGVVLVRERRAEDGHHGIADELLDRAAVALDLLAQACVVWADASAHVFRVLLLGGGREPDQVAEQHRYHLALLERGRGRGLSEWRAALQAKLGPLRVLLAARRADRHQSSLGKALERHECPRDGRDTLRGRRVDWGLALLRSTHHR